MTSPDARRPYASAPEPAAISELRTKQVMVRVTPSEYADLHERATASGCGVPEYLRRCADAVAYIDALQEASHG